MEQELIVQIASLRKALSQLREDTASVQKAWMDIYLKAENTEALPPHRNTLTDTLASVERIADAQEAQLDSLEQQAESIYVSPGATDETPEQLLERMKAKTQAGDKLDSLNSALQEVETAIGSAMKQVQEVHKEVVQSNASQELAALKAKLGVGKKKLSE